MKVWEFSRELGITNNQVKIACADMGTPIKHHMLELEPPLEASLREYFENADKEEIKEEEKKKVTRPWDGDDNPWSLDMLRLKKKHPGFIPHFTTREDLQKKLDQGWKIADAKDYGGVTAVLPGEEAKDGSVVKRREMILIELPEELAQKRRDFIAWKTNERTKAATEMARTKANKVNEQIGGGLDFEMSYKSKKGY
jgi:hypothetical protein